MIAVISDVHSNAAALEAVVLDIRRRPVDAIYCLGDCVGYNAFPAETIEILQRENILSLKGNHDMMATGELTAERCGPNGRLAITWTRSVLTDRDAEFLRALPRQRRLGRDILMIHSRLNDPVSYLVHENDFFGEHQAVRALDRAVSLCFTGHTHKPRLIELRGNALRDISPSNARLDPRCFYFINPGSVGHPRRTDYRASYVLFDPVMRRLQWRRVAYDRTRTSAGNLGHGIQTDLGPGVVRHAWERFTNRCKGMLRRNP